MERQTTMNMKSFRPRTFSKKKARQLPAGEAENSFTSQLNDASNDCIGLAAPSLSAEVPSQNNEAPNSPQAYFEFLMRNRGYCTRKYSSLKTGYYSKPSALQKASYSSHLINLVRSKNVGGLKAIFDAGISPNPCNSNGDSLIHIICKSGDVDLLMVQLSAGARVQVVNRDGQNPLHEVCFRSRPNFEMAGIIAGLDLNLFNMMDKYGNAPLSYARVRHWPEWISFLESKKDIWWPLKNKEEKSNALSFRPQLLSCKPNSRPLPDPSNALTLEMTELVASGQLSPSEVFDFTYDSTCEYDDFDSDYETVARNETDDEDTQSIWVQYGANREDVC